MDALDIFTLFFQPLLYFNELSGIGQDGMTFFGQYDAFIAPLEKAEPAFILQGVHHLGHGRRRIPQFPCSLDKTSLAGRCKENFIFFYIHMITVFSVIRTP